MKTQATRIFLATFLMTLLGLSVIGLPKAHATAASVNISIASGCVGLVDGANTKTIDVTTGQPTNLTVTNLDALR